MKVSKTMKLKLLSSILIFFSMTNVYAGKYDVMFGAFSMNAKVSTRTTNISGLGTYEASYLNSLSDHFELNLGYSFTMTNIIGGDYSYGPKLGINYYPINYASNAEIKTANKVIQVNDHYKPYVGIAFNQRQFQSARTSYAGFGMALGCEKYINSEYTIKSEVKMNTYTGAQEATASEMNILIGLVLGF